MSTHKPQFHTTPLAEIPQIRSHLKTGFVSGKSRPVEYRKTQLLQLAYMIQDNRERIYEALHQDMNRAHSDTEFFELNPIVEHAIRAHDSVAKWAKPERGEMTLTNFAMKPKVYKEPKGVVLIIGPFNYPVFCNFMPMIGAIAAGCAVVLKPSEFTPATSALITELFPKYLDPYMYQVVNGAIPETTALLNLHWDHIFFTGSTTVGRIVATAAAKFLTPVTLELGGKNPGIVDKHVNVDATARRILWTKSGNAGQTCTTVDYVMVHRDVHDQFIAALEKTYKEFFPDLSKQSEQMSHLIHAGAYKRLTQVLDHTKGKIIAGGRRDPAVNFLGTTIVDGVKMNDSLMEHELFGPICPIITVDSIEEACRLANTRESPLGCYVFTTSEKTFEYVRQHTTSGAILQNESTITPGVWGVPFGGVGGSGYGAQGGKYTFDEFSYSRASLQLNSLMEKILAFRYPPYTVAKTKRMTMMGAKIPYGRPGTKSIPWVKLVASVALVAGIVAAYRNKSSLFGR